MKREESVTVYYCDLCSERSLRPMNDCKCLTVSGLMIRVVQSAEKADICDKCLSAIAECADDLYAPF